MPLFLHVLVLVCYVLLQKGEKRKGGGRRRGADFLNPLAVTAARWGAACDSVGRCASSGLWLPVSAAVWSEAGQVEDRVLFAHSGSRKLCTSCCGNAAGDRWPWLLLWTEINCGLPSSPWGVVTLERTREFWNYLHQADSAPAVVGEGMWIPGAVIHRLSVCCSSSFGPYI